MVPALTELTVWHQPRKSTDQCGNSYKMVLLDYILERVYLTGSGQLFQRKSHLIQVPKDKKELAGEKGE